MEMLVTKFSKGKYRNESDLFVEPISKDNVKLMGEMIALQTLRTLKKYDWKIADKIFVKLSGRYPQKRNFSWLLSEGTFSCC